MANIERACTRMDGTLNACLDLGASRNYTDPALLQSLRILGNDVYWLEVVVGALDAGAEEYKVLQEKYWSFKDNLTRGPETRLSAAADDARAIRHRSLHLQWLISKRLIDQPAAIEKLFRS